MDKPKKTNKPLNFRCILLPCLYPKQTGDSNDLEVNSEPLPYSTDEALKNIKEAQRAVQTNDREQNDEASQSLSKNKNEKDQRERIENEHN